MGELPPSAQAKLLRVLQQREFERVGGTETLRTDARVVSATHRDLPGEVAAGRFREDLYYRLNVARIVVPPLRDHPEDIPDLAADILRRVERRHGWGGLSLSPEALLSVRERPWPGNVRQLENALARAAIAARGRAILPEHLDANEEADPSTPAADDLAGPLPLAHLLAEVERRAIRRALLACGGNRTRTAESLGISRRQLFDKIREYDLDPRSPRHGPTADLTAFDSPVLAVVRPGKRSRSVGTRRRRRPLSNGRRRQVALRGRTNRVGLTRKALGCRGGRCRCSRGASTGTGALVMAGRSPGRGTAGPRRRKRGSCTRAADGWHCAEYLLRGGPR